MSVVLILPPLQDLWKQNSMLIIPLASFIVKLEGAIPTIWFNRKTLSWTLSTIESYQDP